MGFMCSLPSIPSIPFAGNNFRQLSHTSVKQAVYATIGQGVVMSYIYSWEGNYRPDVTLTNSHVFIHLWAQWFKERT